MNESMVRDKKKKWIQFATLLHLLIQGKPIIDYEQLYVFFEALKLKNNLQTIGMKIVDEDS